MQIITTTNLPYKEKIYNYTSTKLLTVQKFKPTNYLMKFNATSITKRFMHSSGGGKLPPSGPGGGLPPNNFRPPSPPRPIVTPKPSALNFTPQAPNTVNLPQTEDKKVSFYKNDIKSSIVKKQSPSQNTEMLKGPDKCTSQNLEMLKDLDKKVFENTFVSNLTQQKKKNIFDIPLLAKNRFISEKPNVSTTYNDLCNIIEEFYKNPIYKTQENLSPLFNSTTLSLEAKENILKNTFSLAIVLDCADPSDQNDLHIVKSFVLEILLPENGNDFEISINLEMLQNLANHPLYKRKIAKFFSILVQDYDPGQISLNNRFSKFYDSYKNYLLNATNSEKYKLKRIVNVWEAIIQKAANKQSNFVEIQKLFYCLFEREINFAEIFSGLNNASLIIPQSNPDMFCNNQLDLQNNLIPIHADSNKDFSVDIKCKAFCNNSHRVSYSGSPRLNLKDLFDRIKFIKRGLEIAELTSIEDIQWSQDLIKKLNEVEICENFEQARLLFNNASAEYKHFLDSKNIGIIFAGPNITQKDFNPVNIKEIKEALTPFHSNLIKYCTEDCLKTPNIGTFMKSISKVVVTYHTEVIRLFYGV